MFNRIALIMELLPLPIDYRVEPPSNSSPLTITPQGEHKIKQFHGVPTITRCIFFFKKGKKKGRNVGVTNYGTNPQTQLLNLDNKKSIGGARVQNNHTLLTQHRGEKSCTRNRTQTLKCYTSRAPQKEKVSKPETVTSMALKRTPKKILGARREIF